MSKGDWIAIVATVVFLSATVAGLFLLSPLPAALCAPAETGCLREWIGALSGWAAAIAAGLTFILLRRQTDYARMQVDLLVGDALPTLALSSFLARGCDVQLKIDNWNRRDFVVRNCTIVRNGKPTSYLALDVRLEGEVNKSGLPFIKTTVAGKSSAEMHPQSQRFAVKLNGAPDDPSEPYSLKVEVLGVLLGEQHHEVRLEAFAVMDPNPLGL